MRFRDRLQREFDERRARNAKYSLRAFAAFLATDHATLAQILRGDRPAPVGHIRAWARKLGLSPEEASVWTALAHVPDGATLSRQNQLRHWTAEALAVVSEPAHWEVVRRCRAGEARDTRSIAEATGLAVDALNVALARLLRLGLVEAPAGVPWRETTGLPRLTEAAFRRLALARVREKAAEALKRGQFGAGPVGEDPGRYLMDSL